MNAVLEQYGLTVDVALVAVMFLTMFAGYMTVGYAAVVGFTAVSLAMVVGIWNDQYKESV